MSLTEPSIEIDVTVRNEGDRTTIVVTGEIDMATGPRLRAYVDGVVALAQSEVAFDLSEVPFMDSTGLGILMRASRHLSARGATLVVCSPTPMVRRLLRISGFERLLEIEA